jgi:glycosyltransferase involved in cell wall biosynthesis
VSCAGASSTPADPVAPLRDPVRLVRVIARLNIGGPSIQAITLTRSLAPLGYATTLVRGREGSREGNMDDLASRLGVAPVRIASLRRDPGWHDLRALVVLVRLMRRERPAIVHTHAAKAGTLGRCAAIIAGVGRRRPVLVHTFHGHSLSGYFPRRTTMVYRTIERLLARRTDVLIAVSDEVRDELIALGIASSERFAVVPLGLDLSPFTIGPDARRAARDSIRAELGIPADATVVTLIARLVPIKRVDRFLRVAGLLLDLGGVHFLVVGDGELRDELRAGAEAHALGQRLTWTGFRSEIPEICFASDIVVLTSDSEGTPVSLIEAAAAGLPTVSTRVGGAAAVVLDGTTGALVPREDERGLALAIRRLAGDATLRARAGSAARANALAHFSLQRLVTDLDQLYRGLLGATARTDCSRSHPGR